MRGITLICRQARMRLAACLRQILLLTPFEHTAATVCAKSALQRARPERQARRTGGSLREEDSYEDPHQNSYQPHAHRRNRTDCWPLNAPVGSPRAHTKHNSYPHKSCSDPQARSQNRRVEPRQEDPPAYRWLRPPRLLSRSRRQGPQGRRQVHPRAQGRDLPLRLADQPRPL